MSVMIDVWGFEDKSYKFESTLARAMSGENERSRDAASEEKRSFGLRSFMLLDNHATRYGSIASIVAQLNAVGSWVRKRFRENVTSKCRTVGCEPRIGRWISVCGRLASCCTYNCRHCC